MRHLQVQTTAEAGDVILPPAEIAAAVVAASLRKAQTAPGATFALAVLGGAFIALGGVFFTAAMVGSVAGDGLPRVVGGLVFSLGLILVVIAGAELITGNALMLMAYWRRKISTRKLLRSWGIVFAGNAVGSLAVAALMAGSGLLAGPQGDLLATIATAKLALAPDAAFYRGFLCNALVCLAIWMSYSARTSVGKIACLVLPVAAFITAGFEHSVANLYLIPAGMLAGAPGGLGDVLGNLAPVTAGNLVGAAAVAVLYSIAYRPQPTQAQPAQRPLAAFDGPDPAPMPLAVKRPG